MTGRLVALVLLALSGAPGAASGQPAKEHGSGPIVPGRMLPVVAEHRYTVSARIRPLLLFWISRDNVGGAVLRWRAGAEQQLGFELLIGSDPERAPRHVNHWGYIAEEVSAEGTALLGIMKDADDKTLEEARRRVEADGGPRQFFYKAIRTNVTQGKGVTSTTRLVLARDPTFRDLEWVLDQLPPLPPSPQEYRLPPGAKPGYLPTLQAVVQDSIAWHQHGEPAAASPIGRIVRYVFNGTTYELVMRSSKRLPSGLYRTRSFEDLIEAEMVITNRTTSEKTRFVLQYPRAGRLAGVPVHGVFRPRWWFEVEMTLDDSGD
jgi:hypothetical protein